MIKTILSWFNRKRKDVDNIFLPVLNLIPSPSDERDYVVSTSEPEVLPESYIIRDWEYKNQGYLGSCSAFSICNAFEISENLKNKRKINLSELFLWYNTRVSKSQNSGAVLRNVLQYAKDNGIAIETFWEYDQSKWDIEPSWSAYFSARYFRINNYFRILTRDELKKSILDDSPVIIGAYIYSNLLETDNGVVKRPTGQIIGGHAMAVIGYSNDYAYVLNSWGDGVILFPWEIFDKLVFESWRIN